MTRVPHIPAIMTAFIDYTYNAITSAVKPSCIQPPGLTASESRSDSRQADLCVASTHCKLLLHRCEQRPGKASLSPFRICDVALCTSGDSIAHGSGSDPDPDLAEPFV